MFHTYAKWIHRLRWGIIVLWLALAVAATLWLPNLGQVVSHQNQNFLKSDDPVVVAGNLLNRINPKQKSNSSAVVAIVRVGGLTAADKQYFHNKLAEVTQHKSHYDASYVQSAFNTDKQVAFAFVSKDKSTEIALIGLKGGVVDPSTTRAITNLRSVFA
ncbi:MAG: MMPL family transporter, partial [Alicyclobacillus sp.]|nr:MMPL family transporter [Alicyclobacillus sp.]